MTDEMNELKTLWAETNRHLDRIATAIEEAVRPDVVLDAESERRTMDSKDLERSDATTLEQEEFAAMIEILEAEGATVPPSSYKKIGLESPRREDEPTEEEMSREQPNGRIEGSDGSDDSADEPPTARRRLD